MRVKCSQCGIEDDARWMHEMNTGRSKQYLCHKCHKHAQNEVIQSELRSQKRLRKTLEK